MKRDNEAAWRATVQYWIDQTNYHKSIAAQRQARIEQLEAELKRLKDGQEIPSLSES